MANRILVDVGWEQRIRDKMGVDEAYLADSTLQQPDIITIAEANIIEQIPSYADLVDDAKVYLESAVVCECCVLLCPSMAARLPKKESGPHESHELGLDWDKKRIDYQTERDSYIEKISPSPTLLRFGISYPIREWE